MTSVYERIKSQTNIVDFLSAFGGKVGKTGDTHTLELCPACGHKDCFRAFEKTQTFKCFSCGTGGDVFNLVELSGKNKQESLKMLAERAGVKLENSKIDKKAVDAAKVRADILAEAAKFYRENLKEDAEARSYLLQKRGRTAETIKSFGYGVSIKGKSLFAHLKAKKFTTADILATGLVKQKGEKTFDLFWDDAIIYPLEQNGKVFSFHAKNPKTKQGFSLTKQKDECLMLGLDDLYSNEVTLVEGPEDRHSFLQKYPDKACCAILGQLGYKQAEYLASRLKNKKVCLAFDPDDAGYKYEWIALEKMINHCELVALEWDGKDDIDDYLKKNPDCGEFAEVDLFAKLLGIESENLQAISPKAKSQKVEKFAKILMNIEISIVRDGYVEQICSAFGVKKKQVNCMIGSPSDNKDEAEEYKPVFRGAKCYFRNSGERPKPISSFLLDITRFVRQDDGLTFVANLTANSGLVIKDLAFTSDDRSNKRAFKRVISSARGLSFTGSEDDLSDIWLLEDGRAKTTREDRSYMRFGWLPEEKIWLMGNSVIDTNGKVLPAGDDGYVMVGKNGIISEGVNIGGNMSPQVSSKSLSAEKLEEIIFHFWQMFDNQKDEGVPTSFLGFLALGWAVANVYLPEVVKKSNAFPILLIFGPSGTGKSEATQLLFNLLGLDNSREDWSDSTPTGIFRAMEQLSCLPYWLDEFYNANVVSSREGSKLNLLKNLFGRTGTGKGTANGQQRRSSEINASLCLTGQDRPENKAVLNRSLVLMKNFPSTRGSLSYAWLKDNSASLTAVLPHLVKNKDSKAFLADYKDFKDFLDKNAKCDDRTKYILSVALAGFNRLGYEYEKSDVEKWVLGYCEGEHKRIEQEDVLQKLFNDVELLKCYYTSKDKVILFENGVCYLYLHKIFTEWNEHAQKQRYSEKISEHTIKEYLQTHPSDFWAGDCRKRFSGVLTRCIGISIEKLPSNLKDIVNGWQHSEVPLPGEEF